MFNKIGIPELIIIALLIVLFLGGKKIPELMRGIKEGSKELEKTVKDTKNDK